MKKKYNIFILIYFLLLILYLTICGILQTYWIIEYTFIANGFILFGVIGLLCYLVYKVFIDKKFRIQDIFVFLLTIFDFISYYFAFDRRIALLGFIAGREGLPVILSYYVVFLLAATIKDKKHVKYIFYSLSVCAFLHVLYGIFQTYEITNIFGFKIKCEWSYVTGFLSNSNFYGSFMVLLLGIWSGIYFFKDENKIEILSSLMIFVFSLGLFLSSTMSSIIGLVFMFVFIMLCLFIKRGIYQKKVKKILLFVLILLFSYLWVSNTPKSTLNESIRETSNEMIESVDNGIKDEYGTGRIAIWRQSLKYLPEYFYMGVGIDQFYYLGGYGKVVDPIMNVPVYKAHNEYLQILMTEGIFKCVTYILLLLWIFTMGIIIFVKIKKLNKLLIICLVPFIGYCIQAFFNISIIRVFPIFFLMCGILVSNINQVLEKNI